MQLLRKPFIHKYNLVKLNRFQQTKKKLINCKPLNLFNSMQEKQEKKASFIINKHLEK